MANDDTVLMEGVRIIFRNFAGKAGMYNKEGDRNFAVLLDDDVAEVMKPDGWNVKYLKPREDDEEPHEQAYLPVTVKYRGRNGPIRPPRVVMITSRGRTNLDEDTVELLDFADIANVDLIVRPFHWEMNGKTGVTAYLKSIFITVNEDELERKYAMIDDEVPSDPEDF